MISAALSTIAAQLRSTIGLIDALRKTAADEDLRELLFQASKTIGAEVTILEIEAAAQEIEEREGSGR